MHKQFAAKLEVVKSRLSEKAWLVRVESAEQNAKVMERIAKLVRSGTSLNKAILKVVPESRRSWVIRHWAAFQANGFQALIDKRLPRESQVARECAGLIKVARRVNPKVTAEEVLTILPEQKVQVLPGLPTIKRHFAKVDGRRRYREKKARSAKEVVALPFAGGELLCAAEFCA